MKKSRKILIIVIAVVVVLLLLALAGFHFGNSQSMVLSRAGFDTEVDILLIDRGLDENGAEYQVVQGFDPDQNIKLAYLTKGTLGTWSVDRVSDPPSGTDELDVFDWARPVSGDAMGSGNDNASFGEYEAHRVIYGNDALSKINYRSDFAYPLNTAVSIQQAGSFYLIHQVRYGDPDALADYDMKWMLQAFLGRLQATGEFYPPPDVWPWSEMLTPEMMNP